MDIWYHGIYGFISELELMELLIMATWVGIIVFMCMIYHICGTIQSCKKRKRLI